MHENLLSGIKEEKSGEDMSPNSRKALQNKFAQSSGVSGGNSS